MIRAPYSLPIAFETAPCDVARWISADDPKVVQAFIDKNRSKIAADQDGDHVFLADSNFALRWASEKNPDIRFTDVKTLKTG